MGVKPVTRVQQGILILLMAIGSIALWLAVPVFWLWLASQLQKSSQPSMGPYLLVLAGVAVSVVIIAKLLAAADRAYGRVTGTGDHSRAQLPWMRSMRGERAGQGGQPPTVLTVTMIVSVGICVFCFLVWFFLFAGSSLPQ